MTPAADAPPDLARRYGRPATLASGTLTVVTGLLAALAMAPLASVLYMLVTRGVARLDVALFTELPPAAGMAGGGVGNALLGTLLMVGIAVALSVPFGVLAAVYLAEFGAETRTAAATRFVAKVLAGLPSVLAGLFAYAAVVSVTGTYSAVAGGCALAVLMLPTVLLTAERAIAAVPRRVRDAAVGLGCTPTQAVWHVVLPAALPGLLTGVTLAVARAAGETAPLLFTALFSNYWLSADPMTPTPSLAVLIYNFSGSPFKSQIELAWAASLVLVLMVLAANLAARSWYATPDRK